MVVVRDVVDVVILVVGHAKRIAQGIVIQDVKMIVLKDVQMLAGDMVTIVREII